MSGIVNRVSSLQISMFSRSYVSEATAELQRASEEVSTGLKSDIFADLGARASSAISLRASEENTQAYISSNEVLDSKLEAMLTVVDAVRESAQEVLETALVNSASSVSGAEALQEQARAALESIIAGLNTSYNGDHLFAGTSSDETPMTRWSEVSDETGYSPEQILAEIVGSGPADASEAEAMIAAIDAVFASADSTDPDRNYEATFYSGTPELDESGEASTRVTARINVGQQLDYGVQANDEAFRDIIKGLAMLVSVDVSEITDEDTYAAWMDGVTEALSSGVEGALEISADIGFNQQVVETTQTQLTDLSLVQTTQIGEYENVDAYEAATRLTALETQLEASYTVTARLAELSLLNYL